MSPFWEIPEPSLLSHEASQCSILALGIEDRATLGRDVFCGSADSERAIPHCK